MKKRMMICTLMMALVLLLAACGCKHEWQDASCTAAKTCTLCGEVEGIALGHTWKDATCDAPKTCSVCDITEGEALGHDWQDATTEAPKTCSRCQLTEGERIVTDPRFTTKDTLELQGTWTCELNLTAEMLGLPMGFDDGVDCIMSLEFSNDGEMIQKMTLKDEKTFLEDYRAFVLEMKYLELEQNGISREKADEVMLEIYGLNVEDYVDASMKNVNPSAMFEAFGSTRVYYVQDGTLYTALSWKSQTFEEDDYSVKNGVLIIDSIIMEEGGEPLEWKKA